MVVKTARAQLSMGRYREQHGNPLVSFQVFENLNLMFDSENYYKINFERAISRMYRKKKYLLSSNFKVHF